MHRSSALDGVTLTLALTLTFPLTLATWLLSSRHPWPGGTLTPALHLHLATGLSSASRKRHAAVQCVPRAPSLLIHIAGLRREAVRVVLLALFDVGRRISYLLIAVRIAVVLLWYRACPISHPKDDSTRYAEVGATPQCNPSFHLPTESEY